MKTSDQYFLLKCSEKPWATNWTAKQEGSDTNIFCDPHTCTSDSNLLELLNRYLAGILLLAGTIIGVSLCICVLKIMNAWKRRKRSKSVKYENPTLITKSYAGNDYHYDYVSSDRVPPNNTYQSASEGTFYMSVPSISQDENHYYANCDLVSAYTDLIEDRRCTSSGLAVSMSSGEMDTLNTDNNKDGCFSSNTSSSSISCICHTVDDQHIYGCTEQSPDYGDVCRGCDEQFTNYGEYITPVTPTHSVSSTSSLDDCSQLTTQSVQDMSIYSQDSQERW